MMSDAEFKAGVEKLREILAQNSRIVLSNVEPIRNRDSAWFVLSLQSATYRLYLPGEFLHDLPGTRDYQSAFAHYVSALDRRLENPSPYQFLTRGGIPLVIEIHWPPEAAGDGAWIRLHVFDVRSADSLAIFNISISSQQYYFDLRKNPLLREMQVVNTTRNAVDSGSVSFFARDEHPSTGLKTFPLETAKPTVPSTDLEIERFLAAKVLWLGFRQGDRRTPVWIADPWDAMIFGIEPRKLVQTAQILEADKMLQLEGEFARAGDELLRQVKAFESPARPAAPSSSAESVSTALSEWEFDYFISHASEDKEQFVRPLVEALQMKGARVWYDDFTLRIGDSLRRSIDEGLKKSRFGIVVLSRAFFAKEWPQKELDGLVARERDGQKVILPVWHGVAFDDVKQYSPMLADKLAVRSNKPLAAIVGEILEVLH